MPFEIQLTSTWAALADSPFKDRICEWLRETHALLYEAPKQRLSQS